MRDQLLRRPQVEAMTGLSRSSIYAGMDDGSFPRPKRIGQRSVAWLRSDVEAWLAALPEADPGECA